VTKLQINEWVFIRFNRSCGRFDQSRFHLESATVHYRQSGEIDEFIRWNKKEETWTKKELENHHSDRRGSFGV
jgi:hypothetical protein